MIRALVLAALIGAAMAASIPKSADGLAQVSGIKDRHAQIEAATGG